MTEIVVPPTQAQTTIKRVHSALGEALRLLEVGSNQKYHLVVVYEEAAPERTEYDTLDLLMAALRALPIRTRRLWAYVFQGAYMPLVVHPEFALTTATGLMSIVPRDPTAIVGQDGALFDTLPAPPVPVVEETEEGALDAENAYPTNSLDQQMDDDEEADG